MMATVIGGSFAGLSAAIHIARARRSVCVIDAGSPRNRFSAAAHGFLGQDGDSPAAMIDRARAQVRAYPTAIFVDGLAATARSEDGRFSVTLASGQTLSAAKLVLAFGISDILPEIPGLRDRWGRTVLHCAYCHGYEFADRRLGVLNTGPFAAHQALLISDWGPTTLFLDGDDDLDETVRRKLADRGVEIEPAAVVAPEGSGPDLSGVALRDRRIVGVEALYLTPRTQLNSDIAEQLGCALDDGPLGPIIRTDAAKLTSVPGVYAAGDAVRAPHNATWAAADGVTAGVSLHQSLVFEP